MTAKKLNLFCAVKVMKLRQVKHVNLLQHAGKDFIDHSGVLVFHGKGECMSTFSPATDPGDAMAVLKKCVERAGSDICIFRSTDKPGYWRVFKLSDSIAFTGKPTVFAEAKTFELAITNFAKKLYE